MKEDIKNVVSMLKSMDFTNQIKAICRITTEIKIKPGFGFLLLKESSFFIDILLSPKVNIALLKECSAYLLNAYSKGYITKNHHCVIFSILNGNDMVYKLNRL